VYFVTESCRCLCAFSCAASIKLKKNVSQVELGNYGMKTLLRFRAMDYWLTLNLIVDLQLGKLIA
jgi:hypothetical protein